MDELLLATTNKGKLREVGALFAGDLPGLPAGTPSWRLVSPPDLPDVEETGATFAENALLKARAAAAWAGRVALADDSGLEVAALGGRPGLYSARFAATFGLAGGDAANRKKLLDLLRDVPEVKRGARFVCVAAVAAPDGAALTCQGEWEGRIAWHEAGSGGFGYDAVFIPHGCACTVAEMDAAQKNAASHRARAFAALRGQLAAFLAQAGQGA